MVVSTDKGQAVPFSWADDDVINPQTLLNNPRTSRASCACGEAATLFEDAELRALRSLAAGAVRGGGGANFSEGISVAVADGGRSSVLPGCRWRAPSAERQGSW